MERKLEWIGLTQLLLYLFNLSDGNCSRLLVRNLNRVLILVDIVMSLGNWIYQEGRYLEET